MGFIVGHRIAYIKHIASIFCLVVSSEWDFFSLVYNYSIEGFYIAHKWLSSHHDHRLPKSFRIIVKGWRFIVRKKSGTENLNESRKHLIFFSFAEIGKFSSAIDHLINFNSDIWPENHWLTICFPKSLSNHYVWCKGHRKMCWARKYVNKFQKYQMSQISNSLNLCEFIWIIRMIWNSHAKKAIFPSTV